MAVSTDTLNCYAAISAGRGDMAAKYLHGNNKLLAHALDYAAKEGAFPVIKHLEENGFSLSSLQKEKRQVYAAWKEQEAKVPSPAHNRYVPANTSGLSRALCSDDFGIIVIASLSAGLCVGVPALTTKETPHEDFIALSMHEKQFSKDIFGDMIDTTLVLQHKNTSRKGDTLADVRMKNLAAKQLITYYGENNYAADATTTVSPLKFGVFAHEMAHVWQIQMAFKNASVTTFCRNYDYTVAHDSKLSDYCSEQQASLFADYALMYHFNAATPTGRIEPKEALSVLGHNNSCWRAYNEAACAEEQKNLLAKVVEEALPAAKATRLARERTPNS